jgi:uncharacterized membrane protein
MVGKRIAALRFLILTLAGISFLGASAVAQVQVKPDEEKTEAPLPPERKQQDPLVQLIRALTPEQKAKLMESIKTWQQLGPELKTALRARDKAIRKTLSDEVQAALEGSAFTKEQRDLFEKRYREERKKLEASLRTEFEARRKAALEEMIASLKKSVVQGDPQ